MHAAHEPFRYLDQFSWLDFMALIRSFTICSFRGIPHFTQITKKSSEAYLSTNHWIDMLEIGLKSLFFESWAFSAFYMEEQIMTGTVHTKMILSMTFPVSMWTLLK